MRFDLNSTYYSNIHILKERFKNIFDTVEEYSEAERNELVIESEIVDNKKVLTVSTGTKSFLLDSMYSDEGLMNSWVSSLDIGNSVNCKVITFGFGNGKLARRILETYPNVKILTIEPSLEIFSHVLHEYNISDILVNERFVLLCIDKLNEREIRLSLKSFLEYSDVDNYTCISYPNYELIYDKAIKWFKDAVLRRITELNADFGFVGLFGKRLNENTFSNIKHLINSRSFAELINGAFENVPAIIVAAGPSLDKNINELKAAEGKAVIIAVDAAVNPLLDNGITPNVIISVDPIKDGKYLKNEFAKKIPMIATLSTNAEIMDTHLGPKWFVSDARIYVSRFLRDREIFVPLTATGGSVANNAISVAMLCRCSPIILVGQDLGFEENRTHAEGSVRGKEKTDKYGELLTDVDIYGKTIFTCAEFIMFREWIEDTIKSTPGLEIVDATEGGARIQGTAICTLRDVIENRCKKAIDINCILDRCLHLMTDGQKRELIDYMGNIPNIYKEKSLLLGELESKYIKMKEAITSKNYYSSDFKRLAFESNCILNHLETDISMEYVRDMIQDKRNHMIKSLNSKMNSEEEDLMFICNQGIEYVDNMKEAINQIVVMVDRFVSTYS